MNTTVLSDTTLKADVVVVGGGLVGGTLACALATHGIPVLCVDTEQPATLTAPTQDGRCSAIALACQKVLDTVGIWKHMRESVQPILDIRVTDSNSPLHLHYDHREIGSPMGYMAGNTVIRQAVLARLKELKLATLAAPARVVETSRSIDTVLVKLDDGRVIRTSLLVAADGRNSRIRDMAGIPVAQGLPYHQTGIVLTVRHEKHHRGIAHERFLPAGPFAILPLVGGYHSSLVWTESSTTAKSLLALPDDAFQEELVQRFGTFLGEIDVVSPRFSYPLSLQHALRYTDRRLVLVGDAAHGMHPVAGQGMNFGLRDVAALVEEIVKARRLGLDVGTGTVLESYQRWRRFDNVLMLGMTDALVRLFSNDNAPLRLARTMGLAAVNQMPGLRRFFMRHAMGEVGDLPRLMRGLPV